MPANANYLLSHPDPSSPHFGTVTLDGIAYIEQPHILCQQVTVSTPSQVQENIRLTIPGQANFLLKGLSNDIIARDVVSNFVSSDIPFRFRLSNQQGSSWFFSGGLGVLDDRVIATLCFGTGQFPYPLIPPIAVPANGTLLFDVEDMVGPSPGFKTYTIYFAFHGTYLYPVQNPMPASRDLNMGTAGVA